MIDQKIMRNKNRELEKKLSLTGIEGISLLCKNTNEQKEARSQSAISNDKSTQLHGYS